MILSNEVLREAVAAARNHRERAQEGRELLAASRTLQEMTTPLVGPSQETLLERRKEFCRHVEALDDDALASELSQLLQAIQTALGREDQGTSELYWKRIIVLSEIERRSAKA